MFETNADDNVPDGRKHVLSHAPDAPDSPDAPTSNETGCGSGSGSVTGHDGDEGPISESATPAKPKKALLSKLGLDVPTVILMLKGSLPPTIGIAIFQANAIADQFTTLGYLVAIIAVFSMAILPRGKLLQMVLLNISAICFGTAISMLILWSGIQARLHTSKSSPVTSADAPAGGTPPYNSSHSAVSAVWLFANIWFANVLRAKLPSFNIPVIIYSILINISATFAPATPTTAQAEALVRRLFTAMLLGQALGVGVSLLVFPLSSRQAVFWQMRRGIALLRQAVKLQKDYLQGLEREDMFKVQTALTQAEQDEKSTSSWLAKKSHHTSPRMTKEEQAAKDLRETISKLTALFGKIQGDIKFAKRDAALGHLRAEDISELTELFRFVMIPTTGMSTIMDIFHRVAETHGWSADQDSSEDAIAAKDEDKRVWNEVMKQLHEPFEILSEAVDQGLEHAGTLLGILPRPKEKKGASNDANVEAKGDLVKPGDIGFAEAMDRKVKAFHARKGKLLAHWAHEKGLAATEDDEAQNLENLPRAAAKRHEDDQIQLYVLLYMETLMHATGEAVQDLVAFADKKVADGTMGKKRLIHPTYRRLKKWVLSVFRPENTAAGVSSDIEENGTNVVYVGDSYNRKKNPDHLPAETAWQHLGNGLRAVSKFFGSAEALFGLRVACATMTVGIVAFLEQTHVFFTEQRLVWAMIIIAIGMTMTSGQAIFGFFCRVGGTCLAMVFSLIIWYIVDGKTAGILVFLWLFIFVEYYFFIKYPRFIPAVLICIVTQVLIIGYELQTRKIGIATSESSGQRYYPVYLLAPYRLATVAGGCLVAFFWTVFPSPLTDRTWLRRDLSATLYLLANYFSVVDASLKAKRDHTGGDFREPGSPQANLLKLRRELFGKLTLLLPSLDAHANFQKWEPSVGGRFPIEVYEEIIMRSRRITSYLTLMAYTVTWTPRLEPRVESTEWRDMLRAVLADIKPAHHQILSTLTLLSNSLLSGQSLPPFLPLPKPYDVTRRLLRFGDGNNILDARHVEQTGYAEFAIMQVCSTLICDDLEALVRNVSGLVGVVDFSFRVDRSDGNVDGGSSFTDGDSRGRREKGKTV